MPADRTATLGLPYISRAGTPWDMLSDSRGFVGYSARSAAPGSTLHYQALFAAKGNATGRVNLQLDTLGAAVAFDAVSVREILSYSIPSPSDWHAVAMAPRDRNAVFGCQELGWGSTCAAIDTAGQPVSLPVSLLAGQGMLLLRADSPLRR